MAATTMDPGEAHRWLDSITGRGWRLTLERVVEILRRLGEPQRDFAAVHVTGTNGKGSCCAFTEAILLAAGLRAGRFTSPHVMTLEERVRIGGARVSPETLAAWLSEVRHAAGDDQPVTYFEAMTSAAFLGFAQRSVPLAAVEVGLGGRLDATRTCEPAVCVITRIARDHTRILGDTTRCIAGEKAGILRPGVPVVTAATGEALDEITRRAAAIGAPLRSLGRDFGVRRRADGCWDYEGPTWTLRGFRPALAGAHQGDNAACALAAAELLAEADFPVTPGAATAGVAQANLRGRLERLRCGPVECVVDCAHNADGAEALARALVEGWPDHRVHLIYGALADKDAGAVLAALAPRVARATVVTVEAGRRTRPASDLLATARARLAGPVHAEEDPVRAVRAALAAARPNDLVLVAGSVYLAGTILTASEARQPGSGIWPEPHLHATVP